MRPSARYTWPSLQAAQALVEDRKRDRGVLDEALLAEAQRTYHVLRLEGPDNVAAHAHFVMHAIENSLADRSVDAAEIDRCLHGYIAVAPPPAGTLGLDGAQS